MLNFFLINDKIDFVVLFSAQINSAHEPLAVRLANVTASDVPIENYLLPRHA